MHVFWNCLLDTIDALRFTCVDGFLFANSVEGVENGWSVGETGHDVAIIEGQIGTRRNDTQSRGIA